MPARRKRINSIRTHSSLRSTLSPPRLSFPCPQPRWVPRRAPRWSFLSTVLAVDFLLALHLAAQQVRPRLASLRKQSRTPGPPAFATTTSATFGFQLWLELPRRHLTPPFHDTVERFPRLFSPRLLRPRSSFLTPTYPSAPRPSRGCLPNHSALSHLFSLCSPSLLVRRSPAFFLLFFPRKWLTPPFTFLPPLPLICVISCFLYFSSDSALYMHVCVVDERVRRTDSVSEDGEDARS